MDSAQLPKMPLTTRRKFLLTLGSVGGVAVAGGWFWSLADARHQTGCLVRRKGYAMGAEVSITAIHENLSLAERAVDAAFAELRTVQSVMSLYLPQSQLSRLNREGVLKNPHSYLVKVLAKAQVMSAASDGDFYVTVQPLWNVYSAATQRGCGGWPSVDQIKRAKQRVY